MPDGRYVAFLSDREGAWNAWYAELDSGNAYHIGRGCEPTWFWDGEDLAWISTKNAKEGSGIFRHDLATKQGSVLQDAGAPRGREYCPTISAGDGFLLWAACPPGDHSHATANYQLFVRQLPDGEAVRITFDGYINRWPKRMAD